MRKNRTFPTARFGLAAALCALAVAFPVVARSNSPASPAAIAAAKAERQAREQAAIRAAVARGELMPLPRILAIAQARVPGQVLKVEIEQEQPGFKYEVKILTGTGRVREVNVDARTGRIVEIEDE